MNQLLLTHLRGKTTNRLVLSTALLLASCGGPQTVAVSDQIAKVWTVQSVRENGTVVYSRGGTGNARDYRRYRLDLSNPPAASLTDWDGLTFIGQYELQGSTRLVLRSLNPQPTDTNGTIEFALNWVGDAQLDLTRATASPKTGGSTNQYVLTTP